MRIDRERLGNLMPMKGIDDLDRALKRHKGSTGKGVDQLSPADIGQLADEGAQRSS